jgi:hypothetical protein
MTEAEMIGQKDDGINVKGVALFDSVKGLSKKLNSCVGFE